MVQQVALDLFVSDWAHDQSCPGSSVPHFREPGGPFFATLGSHLGDGRVRKADPFWVPDSGTENGSVFRPLTIIQM